MRHLLVLSAMCAGMSGCVADDAPETEGETELEAQTSTSGTIAGDGWLVKTISLTQVSDVSATLNWSKSSVNLNLFLQTSTGAAITSARGTTTRPEVVSATALAAGTYRVAIKNASSVSTAYTLSIVITPKVVATPTYPAQPKVGTLFWGAAIGGGGDPGPRHETPSGQPLSLRRTYYSWEKRTGSMITTAKDDVARQRLPWVSIKPPPPPSWAAMGNGTYDAEIDQMLNALKTVPGPVWLTVHHEPEGGGGVNSPDDPGGPAAHIAMNRRVRERMTALAVKNVALAPILMTYTFKAGSGRNPEEWWAPGIYDFFGVDHYAHTETTLLDSTWATIRTWAKGKSAEVAVGEWGMRGTDAAAAARMKEWYEAAANSATDGKGARVVGLSAFDSNLNSPDGGWELMGEQLTMFWDLLADPRTASIDSP